METRALRYFMAVAEERHLGRAAARLGMSEPPLTRHIKALEQELAVALFVRSARGMALTQAGEALWRDAKGMFNLMDQAAERAQRTAKGQTGSIAIGLYGSGVFDEVPRLLTAFRATHPDVGLSFHYAQTPDQVMALRQGRVLIVFERLLPSNEPDLEVELVAREPLLLAMCASHPLASKKRVRIKDLEGHKIILGSSPVAAATAVEMCRRHGFEPQFAPAASDLVMASLLACLGMGVALVPRSITNVAFPDIVYRPIEADRAAYMDLHCYYLRGERSPLLRALLDTLRATRRASRT
jgi:LysR family transcriptional regulator, benzoate and cis,cis-muconate-responsive activator of ben and cat genes